MEILSQGYLKQKQYYRALYILPHTFRSIMSLYFFHTIFWTVDLILVLQVGNSDLDSLNDLPQTKDLVNVRTEPQIPTL